MILHGNDAYILFGKSKASLSCMVGNMERVVVGSTCHLDLALMLALLLASLCDLGLKPQVSYHKLRVIMLYNVLMRI